MSSFSPDQEPTSADDAVPSAPPSSAYDAPAKNRAVDPTDIAAIVEIAARQSHVVAAADDILETASRVAADAEGATVEHHLEALAAASVEHGLSPVLLSVNANELTSLAREGTILALRFDTPGTSLARSHWLVVCSEEGSAKATAYEIDRGRVLKRPRSIASLARMCGELNVPCIALEPHYALDPIKKQTARKLSHVGQSLLRLWSFAKLERRELTMVLIYAVFIGLFTLVTPVAVQSVVNTVAFGNLLQPLVILTLALFAGLSFSAVLEALRLYVVEVVQRRVFVRTAADFGRRLTRLDIDVHDKRHVPELSNRFFDVITVQKSASTLAVDTVGLVLQTVMGLLLLAFYHPLLLAFDVVLLIILIGVAIFPARRGVYTAIKESKAKFATAAWIQQIAAHPAALSSAEAVDVAAARTDALCRRYLDARSTHWRTLVVQLVGGLGLKVIASVLLLGVGGWLVIQRQLTLGQLVAAELVVAAIGSGFGKLSKQLEKLYDATAAMDKLGEVVDQPRERDGGR
ncbi:MAG: ABC transporter transmembrane domain-containing protein, partial [Myxococcota bacterium]